MWTFLTLIGRMLCASSLLTSRMHTQAFQFEQSRLSFRRKFSSKRATEGSDHRNCCHSWPLCATSSASVAGVEYQSVPSSKPDQDLQDALEEPTATATRKEGDRRSHRKKIRAEGGLLAFDTPFGALNLFAIYWGSLSVALGAFWYAAFTLCRIFYFVTGNRVDKKVRRDYNVFRQFVQCALDRGTATCLFNAICRVTLLS